MLNWLGRRKLHKETIAFVNLSVPRGSRSNPCPSSLCPEFSHFCPSAYTSGVFHTTFPVLKLRMREPECEWGPLRGSLPSPAAPYFSQTQSSLIFIARYYGDSSSQHWYPELGIQMCGWDPSLLRDTFITNISFLILNCHTVDIGSAHSASLPLLPVSV